MSLKKATHVALFTIIFLAERVFYRRIPVLHGDRLFQPV